MGQFFVLTVSFFPPQVSIPSTGNAKKKAPSNPPTLVPLPCSASPPALSQSSPLALHSYLKLCRATPQQHFSVIQSTGLAANSKPLALLTQPRRESSPSSSPQHLPLSLCSSPKPLSVPSPPHSTLTLSTSPKPFGLTSSVRSSKKSSPKPHQHAHAGAAKSNKRKQLEASLAQINEFRLKQVRQRENSSWIRPLYYDQGHVHMYNVQCER